MQEKKAGHWDGGDWEMRVGTINWVVRGNLRKPTAEQRPPSAEEMGLGEHVSLSPPGILPQFPQLAFLPGSWSSCLRKAGQS